MASEDEVIEDCFEELWKTVAEKMPVVDED